MSFAEPEQAKGTTVRVLACALCKQRRVKCSRSFPCTNCIRAGVQCVQPTVHQRRRRYAERGLLDRLHHYEDLLRQNNIPFEPFQSLHGSTPAAGAASRLDDDNDAHPPTRSEDKEDKEDMYVYDCIWTRTLYHKKNSDFRLISTSSHRNIWQSIKRVVYTYNPLDVIRVTLD
jgi:Fungal Zn(2)-Cys(6) binuclear cluster domain